MRKAMCAITTFCFFAASPMWAQEGQAKRVHETQTKAASAEELFQQLSPSVLVVESSGLNGRVQGSAVALGTNVAVTNCHVILPAYREADVLAAIAEVAEQAAKAPSSDASDRQFMDTFKAANLLSQKLFGDSIITMKAKAKGLPPSVRLRQGEKEWPVFTIIRPAELENDNDLCLLFIVKEDLRPVQKIRRVGELTTVGERVFAIGAPKGLELSLSEGIVSRLETAEISERELGGKKMPQILTRIQTTAAISPGSSGGGLFDRHGALIGITTSTIRDGQNLNFALPAYDAAFLLNYSRPK